MLWCIHCEDKADGLSLRQEVRPTHIEYLARFDVPVAGPLLDDDGQMCGSCIILEAPDRAAAEEFASNDPYAQAGLFEKVTIKGFVKGRWPGEG